MKMMTKVTTLSLSIIVLLSRNACSIYLESESHIKSATFLSKKFEVGLEKIALKTFLDIDFPKGHIGVKSFEAEVIDEDGNYVPLYEAYLHHWFAVKYIENITMSHYIEQSHGLRNGIEYERNDGTCQGFMLPHYWGLGGESRGTSSNLPDPFAIELGKEAGNERGYLVAMSVCYPKPGSIKIKDGEILTLESIYVNKFCTGVMGYFYIYLAIQLPKKI
ncbi:hypothetical protein V8G54_009820 [Vigna mungo]|uniref:Uncharacterized protein n=1 Tax=Vigna mungo TaxID=3915 RepID=A0AAQ3NYS3_VIGMU